MTKNIDLAGLVQGNLTILRRSDKQTKKGEYYWVCVCSCGLKPGEFLVRTTKLTGGQKYCKHCSPKFTRHGHRRKRDTSPEYKTWHGMNTRCYNSNHEAFEHYGGRGILVCDRWRGKGGFEHFLEDMGQRPKGFTLDRIDVDDHYELSNCRWANATDQARNKRPRKLISQFSDSDIQREYWKRFPEPEYGLSMC